MTYRDTDYREYCAVCEHPAVIACKRCARPLCSDHGPVTKADRCADCEAEFYAAPGRLAHTGDQSKLGGALAITIGGTMGAAFMAAGVFLPAVAFSGAALAVFGLLVGRSLRHEQTRKKFLKTGVDRKLLGDATDSSDHHEPASPTKP